MKSFRKIGIAIGLCAVMLAAVCLTIFMPQSIHADAAYGGNSGQLTIQQLFSQTNTFDCSTVTTNSVLGWKQTSNSPNITSLPIKTNVPQYNVTYNKASRNTNTVLPNAQITVLTHGWLANAAEWSKKKNAEGKWVFAYDSDSLITQLSNKAGGANIYWAKMKANRVNKTQHTGVDFDLIDITNQSHLPVYDIRDEYIVSDANPLKTDKHIILVFESGDNEDFNENVYYELNYVLSKIVYEVKIANGGLLPKVNLIGHSRGGITNLMYALDHPDMVDSLISMGTPYLPNNISNLSNYIRFLFIEASGLPAPITTMPSLGLTREVMSEYGVGNPMPKNFDIINHVFGMGIIRSNAVDDLCDVSKYNSYINTWNSGYQSLYSNIKVKTVAAYMSIEYFVSEIVNIFGAMATYYGIPDILVEFGESYFENRLYDFADAVAIGNNSKTPLLSEMLDYFFSGNVVTGLVQILLEYIKFDPFGGSIAVMSDIIVPHNAQIGKDETYAAKYTGFTAVNIRFEEGADTSKKSGMLPFLLHMIEPRALQIIDYIINDSGIKLFKGLFITNTFDDGVSVGILSSFELPQNFKLTIPSKLNGKPVVAIADNAFYVQKNKLLQVTMPTSIRTIGNSAFSGCNISEILIPSSVTSIGDDAFINCASLKNVTFENGSKLETISDYAFKNSGITSIALPNTLKSMGYYAFSNCTSLTKVTFDNGSQLQSISNWSFYNCTSLRSVAIPASVINIGYNAFRFCTSLAEIIFANGSQLQTIGGSAFFNSGIESITIPNTVTLISAYAFYNCSSLTEILFANGSQLQTIENNAFYNSGIKNITIPKTVTNIGEYAFMDSTSLVNISFVNGSQLQTIDIAAFENSGIKSITIPSSVTSIGYNAFKNCAALKNVEFASGSQLQAIAYSTFEKSGIESIAIPSSVTNIANNAFSYCRSLKEVTFANGIDLQTIGNNAFYNSGIESITIPNSVTFIDKYAFGSCYSLAEVIFADGSQLQTISDYAFYNSDIESITIPKTVTNIGSCVFGYCVSLRSVIFENENELQTIGGAAFHNSGIVSIFIPKTVTNIDSQVFGDCTSLTSVTFANESNLQTIGSSAFQNTDIKSITIPNTVTSIGSYVFADCISLTSVIFTNGLQAIGYEAFNGCRTLKNVVIPESVISIGSRAFANCTDLQNITIASSNPVYKSDGNCIIRKSDNTLILGCKNSIIPDGVTRIDDYAFFGCTGLLSIDIPDSVTSIGIEAFSYSGILNNTANNSLVYADKWVVGRKGTLSNVSLKIDTIGIADYVFADSGLNSVIIPSSVIYIDRTTFWSSVIIYVEVKFANKPNTWPDDWNNNANFIVWDYKSKPHTVTFDRREGTGGSGSATVVHGEPMPSATAPSLMGRIFQGYFSEKNGGGIKYYSASMTSMQNYYINGNITLYAFWSAPTGEEGGIVWNGPVAGSFAGGNGTSDSPYQISNGAELAYLAYLVNLAELDYNQYFILTADICLNDTSDWLSWETNAPAYKWVSIGTLVSPFNGNFNGNGFAVKGIYLKHHTGYYEGLFGVIKGATICNLGIEDSYIYGISHIGGITGYMSDSTIINCYNAAWIQGTTYVGGIAGYVEFNNIIANCYNSNTVSAFIVSGGIAGRIENNNIIINNYNSGEIGGTINGCIAGYLGGSIVEFNYSLKYNELNFILFLNDQKFPNSNNRYFDEAGLLMNFWGEYIPIDVMGTLCYSVADALNAYVYFNETSPDSPLYGLNFWYWI